MKSFVDKLGGRIPSSKDLSYLEDELYFELPKELQKAYSKYESANEEAYCCNQSSLVCPEDKKEAIGLANAAFAEFKRLVFERLKVNDSSTMIVRETPEDGYKDFNDELLGKLNYGLRESTGNEEVKHNGLKR